ncbi:hypothetical protein HN512_04135 [Candidatus Peregrinibacteria bacterium]|jgi:hypothetical protein|nr:hypothetical protein [Candidatus Peregrinibacteria bacterium]MBT3598998.1 hypothetical protein [Candidatus Peregrinibacteria bacterium]MBT4366970.1 hypothetical protein [Candidatus Peregrinibacteria bacterium]MBT4585563.1 hypothetical protein [Candidatus Peregrinibacteria bacterium]MBT6731291.1 hypothetical protein [Candidatus Peregrinibacteria bacterium]
MLLNVPKLFDGGIIDLSKRPVDLDLLRLYQAGVVKNPDQIEILIGMNIEWGNAYRELLRKKEYAPEDPFIAYCEDQLPLDLPAFANEQV